jgi:uncharacterized protein YjbI with pentapeptide repeats
MGIPEKIVVRGLRAGAGDTREREIERTDFHDCDFTGQDFFKAALESVTFTRCNLSMADFRSAKLQGVRFVECKLVGISFMEADPFALQIQVESCKVMGCLFGGMRLRKVVLRDCDFQDCSFVGADLSEADFSRSTFRASEFNTTNLQKADFRGASGYQINPLSNNVKRARFSLPEALSLLGYLGVELST